MLVGKGLAIGLVAGFETGAAGVLVTLTLSKTGFAGVGTGLTGVGGAGLEAAGGAGVLGLGGGGGVTVRLKGETATGFSTAGGAVFTTGEGGFTAVGGAIVFLGVKEGLETAGGAGALIAMGGVVGAATTTGFFTSGAGGFLGASLTGASGRGELWNGLEKSSDAPNTKSRD